MSEWIESGIGDLVFSYAGGTPSRAKPEYFGGTIPWISSSEVNQSSITESTEKITEKGFKYSSTKWVPADSVLIAMYGATAGQVAYLRIRATTNQAVLALIPREQGIDSKFLYYEVDFNRDKILYHAQGSGQPNLNKQIVDRTRLLIPSNHAVQRKIARILSTIDGQIEKTEAIIAKYQAVKQGMLQDLFTRGIDVNTGQLRRLDNQDSQQNREYNFPREWACVKLGSYLLKIEQGWSPNCDDTVALINEWGVLKTTAVKWEGYNDQENKKLPTALKPRKEYEVKEEDVLVTRAGPNSRVGVVTFVEKTRSHLIFSDKIYRLSPSSDILPAFLSLALSSNYTQTHLSTFKTGMAESQTNISQSIIKALEVLLPSVNEQRLIIDKIASINGLIDSEKRTLSKLQLLKQGLMQDLLSGKVAVMA
jgi:type I restriction enzyme S subunit